MNVLHISDLSTWTMKRVLKIRQLSLVIPALKELRQEDGELKTSFQTQMPHTHKHNKQTLKQGQDGAHLVELKGNLGYMRSYPKIPPPIK